MQQYNCYLSC